MASVIDEQGRAGGWREVVRCHRLEHPFWLHYLCYAFWGACYAVDDAWQLLDGVVVTAILANLLAVVGGNPLNSVTDVRTDTRSNEKSHIARAVLKLGRCRVLSWAAVEMTGAVALAVFVSWWSGKPLVAVGVALIVLLHLAYNVEPVRLKRRGFAGPIALGLQVGALPYLVAYHVAAPEVDTPVWAIATGLAILATGRALWWLVPDRVADQAAGISTPAVRDAARTSAVALGVTVTGLVFLSFGLWAGYGFAFAALGTAVSGMFVIDPLVQVRRVARGAALSAVLMRRRGMSRIVFANLVLASIPLLA